MTAEQMAESIAKRGAKAVAAEMNQGKGLATWSYVQDRVASGELPWLKIAAELKPYTDAGNAEGLDNALADALPKSPEQVLGMLGASFRPDRVCSGGQFIEAPKQTVIDFLKKAQNAVQGVQKPAIVESKQKCLSEIETSMKALTSAR
jgi:hypothetical protein